MRYLTKSRFRQAIECPTKLYYTKKDNIYANVKLDDNFLKTLADGGFQVEELARLHYPNGVLIEDDRSVKDYYEHSLKITNKHLQKKEVTLYEAAFKFEKLFIRTDILIKKGNKVKLVEVKAKSFNSKEPHVFISNKGKINSSWKPYIYDLAFQKYVLKQAYPEFEVSAFLMMADKSKKASIDGLNQLFRITNNNKRTGIDRMVDSIELTGDSVLGEVNVDEVLNLIYADKDRIYDNMNFHEMIKIFSSKYYKDEKINWPIGWHCKNCEFKTTKEEKSDLRSGFKECWKEQSNLLDNQFNEPNIFDLWNFRSGKKILSTGKFLLRDLNEYDIGTATKAEGFSTQHRQWVQVEKTLELNTKGHADFVLFREDLKNEMNKWKFPLHFIDFETSSAALPFTKGRRPYEQVAFQYSHHSIDESGKIKHSSQYIDLEPGKFPNFDFVRALKKSLSNDDGTIFKYAKHENSILNAIYVQLSESKENDREVLKDFIRSITTSNKSVAESWIGERKMVDMCELVVRYFYHPYMKGSNSIKSVLPCILKISSYLKNKYSNCLREVNVSSLNFSEDHIWLPNMGVDPYSLLPDIDFSALSSYVSNMESIKDGGSALAAYGKVQYTNMTKEERVIIRSALLKYCELDTLAMVMIWEFFNNEC